MFKRRQRGGGRDCITSATVQHKDKDQASVGIQQQQQQQPFKRRQRGHRISNSQQNNQQNNPTSLAINGAYERQRRGNMRV